MYRGDGDGGFSGAVGQNNEKKRQNNEKNGKIRRFRGFFEGVLRRFFERGGVFWRVLRGF